MSIEAVQQIVREAAAGGRQLRIRGGGSKDFYGGPLLGEVLATDALCGIVSYEPTELVITVGGGTPLAAVEAALAEHAQMLAFEPPRFDGHSDLVQEVSRDERAMHTTAGPATIGGTVACGFSGPRRQAVGALRDFVLGVTIIDGRGDRLRFGGQVMKNVAGYDVARLMAGAMGTLGIIAEVSLKVLPRPPHELTQVLELSEQHALAAMHGWAQRPLPVSATCWHGGRLRVRLSGSLAGVTAARAEIGGDELADADAFWSNLREHRNEFFEHGEPLWRLALPSTSPPLRLNGGQLIEWGGGLRWLRSNDQAHAVRQVAREAGGHATLFRAAVKHADAFHPLSPQLMKVQRRLKAAFDPAGIFNPGRLYAF